ncbi:MAG: response regulator [Ignavibacteriales bacterium]|nr:response regulator [Ignavibacteriales bacterium]
MKRKNKLLIVEDDGLNQKVYKATLPNYYELKICGNDEEFYAALKENEYDLFIIDLALNCGKNGIDLVRELRKMEKYKDTPIIVITAFAFRKDKDISMSAGATKFISKPFNKETLLTEIKKYFN